MVPLGKHPQSHHAKAEEVGKLLQMKFKNSDGNWCNLFTTKVNVDGWQRFGCLLCSKHEMGILKLIKHVHSEKHKRQLREVAGEKSVPSNLVGETINDTENSQLHARLNEINDLGIVGVEYIIEVDIGENLQSIFRCVLCEGRFDLETVWNHLTAYVHRLNYLEKHFPTAFKKLSSLDNRQQKFSFLKKICHNIEYHYGRLSTKVIESSYFYANELEIYDLISNARHIDEKMGRTFEELFGENGDNGPRLSPISDFDELSSTCGLESVSTASEFERSPLIAADYALLRSSPDKKNRLSSISSESISKIGDERKVRPTSIRRSTHGWRISNKLKVPTVNKNMSDDIHTTSRSHMETNNLKFEKREGKSPKMHSVHSTKRVETTVSQNRDRSRSSHRQKSPISCSESFREYRKPENFNDVQRNSSSSQPPHSNRRSDSSSFLSVKPLSSLQKNNSFCFDNTITTSYLDPYKGCSPIRTNSESEIDDDPITIISVLSLLSAFENMLGSLGPKMINLMIEAIAMEKISVNSSNSLLDNTNHCILLDTVKEKLKGHIQADMVEPNKLNGLKKTIKNMDILISEANARTFATKETVPLVSSYQESQDRSAIAAKVLLALHNEGRADISKVDLAHYVDKYIKMSNAKQYDKSIAKQYDNHGIQSWLKEVDKSSQQYDETENNKVTAIEVVEKLPEECVTVTYVTDSIENRSKKKNPLNDIVEGSTFKGELQSKPDEPVTLSDSNLKTLIKNFSILTDTEKHDVIVSIRELDPERMDRLRNEIQIDSFLHEEFGSTKTQENYKIKQDGHKLKQEDDKLKQEDDNIIIIE